MVQSQILSYVAPEEADIVRPATLAHLPLKQVSDFDYFEGYLSNPVNMKAFVSVFITT